MCWDLSCWFTAAEVGRESPPLCQAVNCVNRSPHVAGASANETNLSLNQWHWMHLCIQQRQSVSVSSLICLCNPSERTRRRQGSCTIEHTDKIKFSHGPAMDNSIFLLLYIWKCVVVSIVFIDSWKQYIFVLIEKCITFNHDRNSSRFIVIVTKHDQSWLIKTQHS